MIANQLTESLRSLCEEAVCNFRLPTKEEGELKEPQIINGFLPPKRSGSDDDFPFVIVRPEESLMEQTQTEMKVSIIIGCYSEEYDGYEFCLNVAERIQQKIATLQSFTLSGKYQMRFPISWKMMEQPYPQWQIDLETNWVFRSPENQDDF